MLSLLTALSMSNVGILWLQEQCKSSKGLELQQPNTFSKFPIFYRIETDMRFKYRDSLLS